MAVNYDDNFIDRLQQWAAASPSGSSGDPIALPDDIKDYIDDQWQSMGTYHTDIGDVPADAEERGGTFNNPYDMMQHWLSSGLIGIASDGTLIPSPLINILVRLDHAGNPYYTVFVGKSE